MSQNKVPKDVNPEWERMGATLREVRILQGFTADELANGIGKSRPYVANIEAGRKPLTPMLATKAARFLKVPRAALVSSTYVEDETEQVAS